MILIKPVAQIPVNLVDRMTYEFEGDRITATLGDITEVYDFTGLPEGRPVVDLNTVETALPAYPIIDALKDSEGLKIQLLHYVGVDATEESTNYGWMTAEEYNQLNIEEAKADANEGLVDGQGTDTAEGKQTEAPGKPNEGTDNPSK